MRGRKFINQFAATLGGGVPGWVLAGAAIDLNFAASQYYGGQPSSLLTCTRASSGYAKNSAGVLVPFGANALRITDLGLLIEESRTNLALSSTDLTNATYWTCGSGASVAASSATADPTGATGSGVALFNEGASSGVVHNLFNPAGGNTTFNSGSKYTYTFFFKKNTIDAVQLTPPAAVISGSAPWANYDLTNGVVGLTGGTGFVEATIDAYANGWYRCSFTFTASITATAGASGFVALAAGTASSAVRAPTYAGTSRSVYVWGPQTEALSGTAESRVTSYIPTTTATVARAADNIKTAGALNTLLQTTGRTSVFAYAALGWTPATTAVALNLASTLTSQLAARLATGTTMSVRANSIDTIATIGSGTFAANAFKLGTSWDGTGDSAVANNGTVVTSANAMTPGAAQQVGSLNGSTNFVDGYMRRMTFWNTRLVDATLKGLTA